MTKGVPAIAKKPAPETNLAQPIAREHFIPLRKSDLLDTLLAAENVPAAEADDFRQLHRLLESTFHFEFHQQLESLKRCYAPFDPDADLALLVPLSSDEELRRLDDLFQTLCWLMERANYRRLTQDDILTAMDAMGDFGMRVDVDLSVFERLEVYARGEVVKKLRRRRLRKGYRPEEVSVPVYQRLVVVFRLKPHKRLERNADTHTVYLKMFKDIPKADLEMLLPGTRVKMTLLDQTKVVFPTVSGVAISTWKVVQGALTVAAAGVYGTVAFLGLVGGTLGYGARSFFGYMSTKQKYQLSLTRSLYYRNLDNNAGVFHRLLDEAEEQECREAMLAYFFLWRHAGPAGWTRPELDVAAESFLEQTLRRKIDFEIDDALQKLVRLQIVESAGDRYKAAPIGHALSALDRAWDSYFVH